MKVATTEKASAIAAKMYESYGGKPPKLQMDVISHHNKLYGYRPDEDESDELFQAVCGIVESDETTPFFMDKAD